MSKTIIIGDGPGGLSAGLFLAKNGVETIIFGEDNTAMHYAMLYNYLGIPEMTGSDFQTIARKQVEHFGADLQMKRVTAVERDGDGFVAVTEDDGRHAADFVIFAEGKGARIASDLGLEESQKGIIVDRHGRTDVPGLYAVGRGTKVNRTQAIISAGEGASAALDILSTVRGEEFHDFDTPPEND